jgi:transcriptional regulator with XRE-family HTH domain
MILSPSRELFYVDKAERMRIYGRELRRRRIEAGYQELKEFAVRIGVSNQHLSQVETAYSRDGRPSVGLGDEAMEAVGRELGWRVIDQRHMLGQVPAEEIEYILNPDTARIVEAYDNAPQRIQRAVDALLEIDDADGPGESAPVSRPSKNRYKSAAELAEEMSREGSIGGKRAE